MTYILHAHGFKCWFYVARFVYLHFGGDISVRALDCVHVFKAYNAICIGRIIIEK